MNVKKYIVKVPDPVKCPPLNIKRTVDISIPENKKKLIRHKIRGVCPFHPCVVDLEKQPPSAAVC